MLRWIRTVSLIWTLLVSCAVGAAADMEVGGLVFKDGNQNGRFDPGEPGIAGVAVSGGQRLVTTGTDGKFTLKGGPLKGPFVFISTPAGYKNVSPFYRRMTPETKIYEFALAPSPETAADTFSFVQVTDLHIGGDDTVPVFLEDLREINDQPEKPRFIVPTGDLVNQGGQRNEYENYRRAVQTSGMTFHHVIGNHDLPVTNYADFLGPDYYSFDYGQKHFVMLNCTEPARYTEWLEKDLDRQPKDKGILVFQHYQPDGGLLERLARYPVQGLFYGHWHSNKVFRYGKMLVVSTTPLRFGGIDANPRGFRLVTVEKDGSLRTQFRWGGAKVKPGNPVGKIESPFTLAWSRGAGGPTGMSSPRIDGGRMYIGVQDDDNARDGGVVCLDTATGKVLWKLNTDGSVNGTPVIRDGVVCAVSVTGTVYWIDAVCGKEIRKSDLGPFYDRWVYNSPVLVDGVVYCGTAPYFAAFDFKSGKKLWQAPSLGSDWISSRTSPAVDGNRVFMGVNWSNGFFALDRQNGKVVWNLKDGYGITHFSPLVAGDTVFYAAHDKWYAVAKADGK